MSGEPTVSPLEEIQREDKRQLRLFDIDPDWAKLWKGMPAFKQENLTPYQTINVHFRNEQDRRAFAKLVSQLITPETKFIWWPKQENVKTIDKVYVSMLEHAQPRYPVYVISKGRWESRLTVKALEKINVPYHIVIEPQEYPQYAKVIDPIRILTLPFSNLGQGSIPARNWVWEHSIDIGAERHWILDDNLADFRRVHENMLIKVGDGAIFRAAEDFTDRYENVAISGFNYFMFTPRREQFSPFTLNTRIYSCILIKNDIPYRWRGRYNEDTDLSIRVLIDGWCTVLFRAFIAQKMPTMTMKGGNTDELYKDEGRLKMAQSLKAQHPNLVRITRKWGRWQHHVNFRMFRRNKLRRKPDAVVSDEMNDYGMSLRILNDASVNEKQGGANAERATAEGDAEGICEVAHDGNSGEESGVEEKAQPLVSIQDAGADCVMEAKTKRGETFKDSLFE